MGATGFLMIEMVSEAELEALRRAFGRAVLVNAQKNLEAFSALRDGAREQRLRRLARRAGPDERSDLEMRRERELGEIAKVMRQRSAAGERERQRR